ncbi:uracil-DNA glycosylase [bacterium]|jgi:DNA polymerase|nr:uracil-DNA glycosylase [bacterium]
MSKSQTTQTWKRSLPAKAVVMARKSSSKKALPKSELLIQAAAAPAANRKSETLDEICADLGACQRCKLGKSRTNIVFGDGNPKAELVFVGEAPGENEDLEGRPFIGRAGQLLEKMIEAMGLSRSEVYICNVVKCRPPENRNPETDEIESCSPFLFRQLDQIQPKVVVALGKFAAQTLLQTETRISELRGKFYPYRGAKLIPTFHPAYLLRNPPSKREAWEDLQLVAKELGLEIPKKSP